MGRSQPQPMETPAETRNSSSVDHDDRDLPELREDSEPLDLLKWELEALKLEQGMDGKSKSYSWTSCIPQDNIEEEAEMEVAPRTKKPGPLSGDDRPLGFDASAKKETISIQASVGTEDNPILASKSLDSTSSRLKKHKKALEDPVVPVVPAEKKSSKKTVVEAPKPSAGKNAPLQHHSRPPLPPSKQFVFPAPPPSKPQKDTSSSKDKGGSEQAGRDAKKPDTSGHFHPIIIDTVEPGDYLEPIIVHSGSNLASPNEYNTDSRVDSAVKQVRSSGAYSIDTLLSSNKKEYYQGKIVSPCKNSTLVKSAYHFSSSTKEGHNWSDDSSSRVVTPLFANPEVVAIVDLSEYEDNDQMDADELEAEYARLVGEEGAPDSPTLSATLSGGSVESLLEVSDTEDESLVSPGAATTHEIESDTRKESSVTRTSKPLDDLRQKSMVIAVHKSPKQPEDKQRIDPVRKIKAREPVHHHRDRDEGRETVDYEQEEQPEARQDESLEHMHTASSDYDSQEPYEDDEMNGDEERSEASEHEDKYYFEDVNLSQDLESIRSKRKLDYDIPFFESVVADYFGSGKKGVNDKSRSKTKAGFKGPLFTTGGCCLAFH